MKIYVQLFLLAATVSCLLTVVTTGNWIAGIFQGLSIGIIVSLTLLVMHWYFTKRAWGAPTNDKTRIQKTETIELPLPHDQAFDACVKSLGAVNGSLKREDKPAGRIMAQTALTLKSAGEIIQFDIAPLEGGKSRVQISSKPLVAMTLFDYGKNAQNIEKIKDFLIKNTQS